MARVFISHASDGLAQAGEAHEWLTEVGHEVFLDRNQRDGIGVGEEWRQQLHERLRWADAVVCVVTSTYISSRWCTVEVEIARSRGNRILPMYVEPDLVDPSLESLQHAADYRSDPALARAQLIEALRRLDAAGGWGWPDGRSPFPGLRPFTTDQHRVFFGRNEEKKKLAEMLRAAAECAESVALVVVGPSGCGKSSLVGAGLLPLMASEPGWWPLQPMRPGANPVGVLINELVAAARQLGLEWTESYVHKQLSGYGMTDVVERLLLEAPAGSQTRLLVVIDQFEEVLTQATAVQRSRFVEMLRSALAGPVQIVVTLRPEFLDQMLENPEFATLPTRTYTLRPLSRGALRSVIEGPARLAGIKVDEHLIERLVADTSSGDALPLLAFTLAQLSVGIHRGGQMSAERYEQLGGVRGALIGEADAALAKAINLGQRSRKEVISGLLRLVTIDELGYPTRWRVVRDEVPDVVKLELDVFVERRLLTTDTNCGHVVIGVAHEAFLSAWPPLADAIAAATSALRARSAIEHAATEWVDCGRPRPLLWSGAQLAAAVVNTGARFSTMPKSISEGGVDKSMPYSMRGSKSSLLWIRRELITDHVDLSAKATEFLWVSILRERYRRGRTIAVLSMLLAIALLGAGIAVVQRYDAERQQQIATGRQLVAQANVIQGTDPNIALRLALAAYEVNPSDETYSGLVGILTVTPYIGTLAGENGAISAVAFTSIGHLLTTAGDDGTVVLWDVSDPTRPRQLGQPLTGHKSSVNAVAFTPDGDMLATGGDDGISILWELSDLSLPRQFGQPLTGDHGVVTAAVFAPDGRTLATANSDGTTILWNVSDRTRPRQLGQPLTGHKSSVTFLAFAPDRHILATASRDGTVILWDVSDSAQPHQLGRPLTSHYNVVTAVAFTPDGRTLATANSDGTTILWDVTDRPSRLGQPLIGNHGVMTEVAFDGSILTTIGSDGTATRWDIADRRRPRQIGWTKNPHGSLATSLAVSSDGNTQVTDTPDGSAILWDTSDRTQPRQLGQPLTGHHGVVATAAFTPDGRTLATASSDGTAILWDLSDRTRPHQLGQPLTGHTNSVNSVAFTPDGRTLATASSDGTAILWDLTNLNDLRDHAVERACTITRGGLDHDEWSRYLQKIPYRNSCVR